MSELIQSYREALEIITRLSRGVTLESGPPKEDVVVIAPNGTEPPAGCTGFMNKIEYAAPELLLRLELWDTMGGDALAYLPLGGAVIALEGMGLLSVEKKKLCLLGSPFPFTTGAGTEWHIDSERREGLIMAYREDAEHPEYQCDINMKFYGPTPRGWALATDLEAATTGEQSDKPADEAATDPSDPPTDDTEASRTEPMSKTEMARRLLQRETARPRDVKRMLSQYGIERVSTKTFTLRLDKMDARARKNIETPFA